MIKNNKFILVIVICASIFILAYFGIRLGKYWYYHPRNVAFEYVMEIPKPNEESDYSDFIGFYYVGNEEKLVYFMVGPPKQVLYMEADLERYDFKYIKHLSQQLDYEKFDYIITWQKELKALNYSPYLSKTEDAMDYLDEIPLIPTFDTVITDKVYIYRIKKNHKFRAPGP